MAVESMYVRPKQAAELLGIGLTVVYELMNSGQLPSRKLGRVRLIKRSYLDDLGSDVKPRDAEDGGERWKDRRSA